MASNPVTSADLYAGGDSLRLLREELNAVNLSMEALLRTAAQLKTQVGSIKNIVNPAAQKQLLQLQIQSQRLQQQQNKTAATAAALTIKLNQQAASAAALTVKQNQAAASTLRLQQQQQRAATAATRHSGSLRGLLSSLRTLTYAYFSLAAAQRIVGALFQETKQLNTLDVAFKQTLGSTEAVARAQSFLSDISQKLGVDLLTASNAYLKFGAAAKQAGVSTKTTEDIFKSFTKASSVLGLGAERTSYVFLALEQIMSKGRLSTEELRRQLGEHLPGAFGIAAQAMGITTAKLTDMLKKGQVLSTDFLPKFAKQIEIAYGIQNVERVDNLAAAQARFGTQITLLIRELDAATAFKDFFNSITDFVKFIRENLDAIGSLIKAVLYLTAAWVGWKLALIATNIVLKIANVDTLAAVTAQGLLAGSTARLGKAWAALNTAIKANPIGAILVAAIALVAVFDALNKKVDGAKQSMKNIQEGTAKAAAEVQYIRFQTTGLIAEYGKENTSLERKKIILNQLKQATDGHVGNITKEKDATKELTEQLEDYVAQVAITTKAEAFRFKLRELYLQQQELKDKLKSAPGGKVGAYGAIGDFLFGATNTAVGINREIKSVESQIKGLEDALKGLGLPPDQTAPVKPEGDGEEERRKREALAERLFRQEIARRKKLNAFLLEGKEKELDALNIQFLETEHAAKGDADTLLAIKKEYLDKTNEIELKYFLEKRKFDQEQFDAENKASRERLQMKVDQLNQEFEINQKIARSKKVAEGATEDELKLFDIFQQHQKLLFDRDLGNPFITDAQVAEIEAKLKEVEFLYVETDNQIQIDTLKKTQETERAVFNAEKHTGYERRKFRRDQMLKLFELELRLSKTLTKQQKADLEQAIAELKGITDESESFGIFKLLGINDPAQQKAVDRAFDLASKQISDFYALQSQLKQQEVQETEAVLAAKQKAFDEEFALQQAGYANSVNQARNELNLAKKQHQEALKDQQRYQKAQLAINTILEGSNLVLGLSKITADLGILAIPAWAIVLGAFAAAKIKAFQLASKRIFRKGGYEEIQGGSHESGKDTYIGEVKGGSGFADRGESVGVFTKEATTKYKSNIKDFVKAANSGTLENILHRYDVAKSGISVYASASDIDTSRMEEKLSKLVEQGQRQTYVDAEGNLVTMDRGRTTVWRKRSKF